MPKPNGVTHKEMGKWGGSQGDIGKEGNQSVSQVFTLKQEALAFSGMPPEAFNLPTKNTMYPHLFLSFFFLSFLFPINLRLGSCFLFIYLVLFEQVK